MSSGGAPAGRVIAKAKAPAKAKVKVLLRVRPALGEVEKAEAQILEVSVQIFVGLLCIFVQR
jgi:hypothetical protein